MSHRNPALIGALLGALMLAAPALAAEEGEADAEQSAGDAQSEAPAAPQARQQMPAAQAEMMKTRQELSSIQKQTLENNPDLKERGEELDELVKKTMQEQGHKPDEHISELEGLKEEFESDDLDKKEKQSLLQKAQSHQRKLSQARREAMQDEDVQAARKAYRDDLIAAMKEEDSRTEELLEKMRKQRREMIQQMQQSQQGGMSPSPGGQGQ